MKQIDSGEWVTFKQLESEMNSGCEKCGLIYNGIQKYRQEFEGRDGGGASIYKTAHGISCDIQRKLRKEDISVSPVHLEFFVGKGKCSS